MPSWHRGQAHKRGVSVCMRPGDHLLERDDNSGLLLDVPVVLIGSGLETFEAGLTAGMTCVIQSSGARRGTDPRRTGLAQ